MSVFQGSPGGGSQHELGGLVWEDVEGQENFPISAGFELITHGLLVEEHNYSATTHNPQTTLRQHIYFSYLFIFMYLLNLKFFFKFMIGIQKH